MFIVTIAVLKFVPISFFVGYASISYVFVLYFFVFVPTLCQLSQWILFGPCPGLAVVDWRAPEDVGRR